jgi:hypothetical protein
VQLCVHVLLAIQAVPDGCDVGHQKERPGHQVGCRMAAEGRSGSLSDACSSPKQAAARPGTRCLFLKMLVCAAAETHVTVEAKGGVCMSPCLSEQPSTHAD